MSSELKYTPEQESAVREWIYARRDFAQAEADDSEVSPVRLRAAAECLDEAQRRLDEAYGWTGSEHQMDIRESVPAEVDSDVPVPKIMNHVLEHFHQYNLRRHTAGRR